MANNKTLPPAPGAPEKLRNSYLDALDAKLEHVPPAPASPASTDIDHELTRARRLKNDNAEQNIRLKRIVLDRLFWFLGIETFFVFLFTLMQATGGTSWFRFHLDEWSFNLLVSATIVQITAMLFVAVRYLFPAKSDKQG